MVRTIKSQDINVNEILIITTFELFKTKITPQHWLERLLKWQPLHLRFRDVAREVFARDVRERRRSHARFLAACLAQSFDIPLNALCHLQ